MWERVARARRRARRARRGDGPALADVGAVVGATAPEHLARAARAHAARAVPAARASARRAAASRTSRPAFAPGRAGGPRHRLALDRRRARAHGGRAGRGRPRRGRAPARGRLGACVALGPRGDALILRGVRHARVGLDAPRAAPPAGWRRSRSSRAPWPSTPWSTTGRRRRRLDRRQSTTLRSAGAARRPRPPSDRSASARTYIVQCRATRCRRSPSTTGVSLATLQRLNPELDARRCSRPAAQARAVTARAPARARRGSRSVALAVALAVVLAVALAQPPGGRRAAGDPRARRRSSSSRRPATSSSSARAEPAARDRLDDEAHDRARSRSSARRSPTTLRAVPYRALPVESVIGLRAGERMTVRRPAARAAAGQRQRRGRDARRAASAARAGASSR